MKDAFFRTLDKHPWLNWVVLALATIAVGCIQGNTVGIG